MIDSFIHEIMNVLYNMDASGQIMATSHDHLTPKARNPLSAKSRLVK